MTKQSDRGKLIVFEGPDRVGKSTLVEQLTIRLRMEGVTCEHLASPGKQAGTLGRLVYDLHHDKLRLDHRDVNSTSLQVLHVAAHIDAIEGQILPALQDGTWIVLDRFWWSTWVYGVAKKVPENSLRAMIGLEQLHWGQIKPDVVFLVERKPVTPEYGEDFQGQLVEGYRNLANREQFHGPVVTVRNDFSIEDAFETVWEEVAPSVRLFTQRRDFTTDAQPDGQLTLLEDYVPNQSNVSLLSPAEPTVVYDTFWQFALERQRDIFSPA